MKIPFDRPTHTGKEIEYLADVIARGIELGPSIYSRRCETWLSERYENARVMLTYSGTTALETMFSLAQLKSDDEVILPSYAFPSCANAILRAGATPVLADIDSNTLALSVASVLKALTPKTKAILVLHYAGIPADIEDLAALAREKGLLLFEDAAQGFLTKISGRYLGTYGDMAILSFSTKKTIQCGQGGALILNNHSYIAPAEILRDRGTNRQDFFLGKVKEYSWQDIGTSFSPSELNAAFLWGQLESADEIVARMRHLCYSYRDKLMPLQSRGLIRLPNLGDNVDYNGSMVYILTQDISQRDKLLTNLSGQDIKAQFHFVPLHLGSGSRMVLIPEYPAQSQNIYERLVRLPLYSTMTEQEVEYVCAKVSDFFLQ